MRRIARAVLVAALLIPLHSDAFDGDKWGHDPATSEWFRSLKAPTGIPCCDYADGVRLEDPDWRENEDGTYSVFAKDAWHTIDKDHVVVVDEKNRKINYAVLWWPAYWDHPSCFLPGARG